MKNLLLLLFCIFSLALKAQEKDSLQNSQAAVSDRKNLSFTILEEQPIFPGCEKVDKMKRFECFNEKMQEHVQKHLRYPAKAARENKQGKVYVSFTITTEGTIEIVSISSKHIEFIAEVKRILKKLPKVTPGKQKGENVNISFNFPINFKLQ